MSRLKGQTGKVTFCARQLLFVGFSRRRGGGLVVAGVRPVAARPRPNATAQPPPSTVRHRRQPASAAGRGPRRGVVAPASGRPRQASSDAPALPSGAADAAQSAADVLVDDDPRSAQAPLLRRFVVQLLVQHVVQHVYNRWK